jgi:hypothetical protein
LTDADLRAYLLGQTTEAKAEAIEIRALDEEDFFATVQSVEDDLFDDYVRGRMADDERARFLAKYGEKRVRLVVARALAARTAGPRVVSPPVASRYWMMAAAAALVIGIGLTLGIPGRPSQNRAEVPVSTPAPAAPVPVALHVTLGASRSAAPSPEAVLPPSAATLQLRVRIDPADVFDGYAMELRSDRGSIVWRADGLEASAAGGDLTLVGDVPVAPLNDATYELTVIGSKVGKAPETLGFAAVRIRR